MKLLDSFGRQVNYIRISVTERCNLKCAYCVSGEPEKIYPAKGMLRIKDIAKLVGIFSQMGISKARLTGGEPLMRKGICSLISDLKAIDGIKTVTMTTNGVMLEKMTERLKESGLDRINISLDSLRPDRLKKISGTDIHSAVMGAIEKIMHKNLWKLKINVVAIKGFNDDEILDFAELANRMPVEVRFIEMMPVGFNALQKEKTYSLIKGEEIKAVISEKFNLEKLEKNRFTGPANIYGILGGKGKLGFISPLSSRFCESCDRLRLTSEGKLRSCLFYDKEIDLMPGIISNKSDKWFKERLLQAIAAKPERHEADWNFVSPSEKSMQLIGG